MMLIALRQMEEHLVIQDEEFAIVAVEEKRRRHDVVSISHFEKYSLVSLVQYRRKMLCFEMNIKNFLKTAFAFHVLTSDMCWISANLVITQMAHVHAFGIVAPAAAPIM